MKKMQVNLKVKHERAPEEGGVWLWNGGGQGTCVAWALTIPP